MPHVFTKFAGYLSYLLNYMKLRVGIFFGGPSREREISFAGGRTVYDNLNKSLFEPVPIFVDSQKNFILLDWQYIYKGTIRDFYPPIDQVPPSPNEFQIYSESLGALSRAEQDRMIAEVGRRVEPSELPTLMHVAFLALHGLYGEDGQIQRELEKLHIPYTGSGIRASEIGMDKALQKRLMAEKGFSEPTVMTLKREDWLAADVEALYYQSVDKVGFPMVIRPANQGSSIGVAIADEKLGVEGFEQAINRAFFREIIPVNEWMDRDHFERVEYIRLLSDIRDGLGFPLSVTFHEQKHIVYHPEVLLSYLDDQSAQIDNGFFILESFQDEREVIIESFIHGKEFSCIVLRKEDGSAVALPPTEIVKGKEVFDYRSKYMPGLSRKVTPINLPSPQINAIRGECERLFLELGFATYARIDGFITQDDQIFLNDPNTTSGMLPSSFFFHQAAEIGLNPSQYLTYIIRISLQERFAEQPEETAWKGYIRILDESIQSLKVTQSTRKRIGVILGGYSFERHISVESGRNIFEKLSSSDKYEPIPIFLTGDASHFELYQLPINLLLKDNADDIRDKILGWKEHPVIDQIKLQCADITRKYASNDVVFAPRKISLEELPSLVDGVFIALHGRPGEDGQVQTYLDAMHIPYNGSGVTSSKITIDKHRTLQTLKKNGFQVAEQLIIKKEEFTAGAANCYAHIETQFGYPLVAKPVDDGCSSAVKVVRTRTELEAFVQLMFRPLDDEGPQQRKILNLKAKEEFPRKDEILFENLISRNGAGHFLEITGGLLTHYNIDGTLRYEIFEPSETLATGEVLSLEEKFLAGEGQNITPARFSPNKSVYQKIADQVKSDLERAARILDVQGYARIDAFVRIFDNQRAETLVIEVNSLPGMTPATCIFHQAAINGYKPYDFIDKILSFAFARRARLGGGQAPAQSQAEETAFTSLVPDELAPVDAIAGYQQVQAAAEQAKAMMGDTDSAGENPKKEPYFGLEKPPTPFQQWVSRTREFFTSSYFLRNLGVLLGFLFVFITLFTLGLRWYTRHGESLTVPNFEGMQIDEAQRKARNRSFSVMVLDSIFEPEKIPGTVFQQDPKPSSRVKQNRTIYFSIYSKTPPEIELPTLVGSYDLEQYAKKLRVLKLKAVVKERVFDSVQEENTIQYFFYGDRKITDNDLRKGVSVPQGSTLEFVVTQRHTGMVAVPNLVCQQYKAAHFLITSMNLSIGAVYGEVLDDAYVWKQEPEYVDGQMIRIGEQINIYLTNTKPQGCPEEEPIIEEQQQEQEQE
jgi:UDP-N-acetylmuramate--alanine ligase